MKSLAKNSKQPFSQVMKFSAIAMVLFLLLHLAVNLACLLDFATHTDGTHYNLLINAIKSNAFLAAFEGILSLGFLVHIISAIAIIARRKNDKQPFDKRNAFITGAFLAGFLLMHLLQINYQNESASTLDAYKTLTAFFLTHPFYDIVYMITGMLLGLHIYTNAKRRMSSTRKSLGRLVSLLGIIIGCGYTLIPLFFIFIMLF